MQGNLTITKAIEIHLKEIAEIGIECGLSHWSLESYRNELERIDSIFMVAIDQREIVGFIVMRLAIPNEAEIYNFAVKKNYQNNGIGQKILMQSIDSIMQKGDLKRIWLEVRESNQAAIGFYLKNGFLPVGQRKNFYNNPVENAVLMVREMLFEHLAETKTDLPKDLMRI